MAEDFRLLSETMNKEVIMKEKLNEITAKEIIIFIIMILIPQLLFFWLAPEVACKTTVYIIGTIMTIANAAIVLGLWLVKGMRIAAAPVLLSNTLTTLTLAAGFVLLFIDVRVRTAIYAMLICSLIYALVMLLFVSTLEEEGR